MREKKVLANDPQPFDLWRFVKKVRVEVVVISVLIGSMCFLMPRDALIGLGSLLSAKVLTLTVGVVFAHLMRIFGFPYLSLSDMLQNGQWSGVIFLAMWYSVIVYAVAVGG